MNEIPFWTQYSKKLIKKIEAHRHAGILTPEGASARAMRLVMGKEGVCEEGSAVALYLFVDPEDGVIAEAKFQVFGPSVLLGAAELVCESVIRKNYDQGRRLTTEWLDRQVRDLPHEPAFPQGTYTYLQQVLGALANATEQCFDIPIAELYVPPTPFDASEGERHSYPGWATLSEGRKLAVIEEIIDQEIRPYVELDAGGVKVIRFIGENRLLIAYEGACTTCLSATGTTLDAIQQILRNKVDPLIEVIPDLSTFPGS